MDSGCIILFIKYSGEFGIELQKHAGKAKREITITSPFAHRTILEPLVSLWGASVVHELSNQKSLPVSVSNKEPQMLHKGNCTAWKRISCSKSADNGME